MLFQLYLMLAGNELVQYVQPTEDIGSIFELDSPAPEFVLSPAVNVTSDNAMFPELDSNLNTPQLPSPIRDYQPRSPPMEELDWRNRKPSVVFWATFDNMV